MAGYECSLCQGEEQATLLITPLTGGETMAVGQGCMGVAFTGMLAGHLGVDADKLYDAATRLVKREQARAAKRTTKADEFAAKVRDIATDDDGEIAWAPAGDVE